MITIDLKKISNFEDLKKDFVDQHPFEAVGIIKENVYYKLENIHSDPLNHFEVDPVLFNEWMNYDDIILLHSHTYNSLEIDNRTPSLEDFKLQETLNIPMAICSTSDDDISDAIIFGIDEIEQYENRKYMHGVSDCYTLSRDYYKNEYDYELPLMLRPTEWEKWNAKYLQDNLYNDKNFRKIKDGNIQKGDILIFRIGSPYKNHVGIALDDEKFLHHLERRLSRIDNIKKWSKFLTDIMRLKNDSSRR